MPTAAWTTVDDVAAGMAAIERYPVVLKFDGLAAGKGVVIAQDEAQARGGARRSSSRSGASAPGASSSRSTSTARSSRCSPSATACARSRWRPPRTTSGSSTATRARTPEGWARTRPSPGVDASRTPELSAARPPADRGRARTPRHAVPRRPLRGDHAAPRRAAGARVQRPLRRSRDARRCSPACAATSSSWRSRPRCRVASAASSSTGTRRPRSRSCSHPPATRTLRARGDVITGLDAAPRRHRDHPRRHGDRRTGGS